MCGRYSLQITNQFIKRFGLKSIPSELTSRYNIAPGYKLPVITQNGQKNLQLMQWGLIPFWAKEPKALVINARAESIATKPMFKRSFSHKRCLVPATGFYEWSKIDNKKTPYYIHLKNNNYFSFAGLYDIWQSDNNDTIYSYAIITTIPNQLIEKIHHRMPVVLDQQKEEQWLTLSDSSSLLNLLTPYSASQMEAYPVSMMVNNPSIDDIKLVKKLLI